MVRSVEKGGGTGGTGGTGKKKYFVK